ncbi:trypsin-1-like [Takifugu flavidus]|uniref:trypsin-1-like n=1 Tax=Takifugu flavidus TaxID=433684 RepID=UPI0025442958|nr:trypsin-1-like [Takifugu flavidus]
MTQKLSQCPCCSVKMNVLRCFMLWFGVMLGTVASKELKICDSTERLYHVVITNSQGTIICAGSLISDSWILSEAYCYRWGMKIILGAHPGPGRTIIIQNPPVIRKNNAGMSDLMLLKLPSPTKIEPVKLPTCPLAADPDFVKIAGYGLKTTELGKTDSRESHKLQCVKLKLDDCKKVERKHYFFFHDTQKRMDIPLTDVGGAVIHNDMIYGVMSYENEPHLYPELPYFEVCPILNWINAVTA